MGTLANNEDPDQMPQYNASFSQGFALFTKINKRRHEISSNVVSGTSKASDQPAHICSLIKAIASCFNVI